MDILEKQMKQILKTFDMLDRRKMIINVYTDYEHDEQHLTHFAFVYYAGRNLKEYCKATCKGIRKFDNTADLNIEFSAYKSNKNEVILKKDKMLSHKLLQIVFYMNDWDIINKAYELFIKWGDNRKIHKPKSPVKFEMTVPPDDPTDPNYKQYMKEWFKFCEENPEWIKKLKESGEI